MRLNSTGPSSLSHFSLITSLEAPGLLVLHYSDVIMSAMASQITNLTTVCSTAYSGADKKKHQSSTSLAFVRGIHRWPVNSPHKGPVTRKFFPFDDVILGFAAIITFTNRPGVNLSAGLLDWLYVPSLYRLFIPLVLKQSAFNWTNG